jgi:transposase-like protein
MKCGVCKKHQVIRVAANVRGKDYYRCNSCGWRWTKSLNKNRSLFIDELPWTKEDWIDMNNLNTSEPFICILEEKFYE